METKYLKTIKTILEEGSFQKAAQKLHYTQSTITFQVRQIEQALKVPLFERIGRKMRLTQAGHDLLPSMEAILEQVRQMQAYSAGAQQVNGTLTLAMPETLLSYQMQPVIQAFRVQAPQVTLSIQALNCYEIRSRVQNGLVDIGVHYDVGGYGPSLVVQQLYTAPLALVASPLLEEDLFVQSEQKKLTVIYSDRNSAYQRIFERYLKDCCITVQNRMLLSSTEAIKQCVSSNLGIAVLPRFAVEQELRRHRLVAIQTPLQRQTLGVVCSYHKNKWHSPAMSLFIKIMEEKLNLSK